LRLLRLRNGRWRPLVRRLHGWVALAVGIVLLVVVVSGAMLVLDPEIQKLLVKPDLYRSTPSENPISPGQAIRAAKREVPDFEGATAVRNRGVYEVYDDSFLKQVHIDPGTGEVLGVASHDSGVMGFVRNLHTCGLSCKDYPGYLPLLKHKLELLGNRLTIGDLVLGCTALVLLFLALSGLVLWWPGIKRFARGFRVRRGRGAYATSYDMHKVFGFAALPFLAMWAITGAGFEFKQVEQAWYAVLPGDRPTNADLPVFASKPGSGPGIGAVTAERIAARAIPGSEVTSVTLPAAGDRKGYYDIWVSHGWDAYESSLWSGNTEVAVDRYSGRAEVMWGDPDPARPISEVLWEEWSYPVHAGTPVGWLPRLGWLAFGLVPLLLAVTGTTVWWIRRRKRGRKRSTARATPA
jgi:uncharacterized iron-regulated membrane protein